MAGGARRDRRLRGSSIAPLLDVQHRREPRAVARAARGAVRAVLFIRGSGAGTHRGSCAVQSTRRPALARTLVLPAVTIDGRAALDQGDGRADETRHRYAAVRAATG